MASKKKTTVHDTSSDSGKSQELLLYLLDAVDKVDLIDPADIPDISLYMDQVTTYMDEHLKQSRRRDEDKILTKTMINNYAKNKLLPPPPTTSQASSEVPFKNLSYYEKMKRLSELPKHMTWDEIKVGNTYVIPKILTKKMKIVKVVEKTAAMIRCSEIEDGKESLYMTTIYPNDVEAVFIVKFLTF